MIILAWDRTRLGVAPKTKIPLEVHTMHNSGNLQKIEPEIGMSSDAYHEKE